MASYHLTRKYQLAPEIPLARVSKFVHVTNRYRGAVLWMTVNNHGGIELLVSSEADYNKLLKDKQVMYDVEKVSTFDGKIFKDKYHDAHTNIFAGLQTSGAGAT